MSSHSRSSSEVESIKYSEVLQVFLKEFMKDFDFNDVADITKHLFTNEEYQSIINEKGERQIIIRLFRVLCSKHDEVIEKFLDAISYDYDWLVVAVKNERAAPSKETERYLDRCKMLRNDNQTHTDYNVHRMEPFLKLRGALKVLKRFEKVILHGELGTGKKWLTIDVLYEYSVMKAMDFQIFWIDVSQCCSTEEDLRMLKYLRVLLGDDSTLSRSPVPTAALINQCTTSSSSSSSAFESNRILELQQILRTKLQNEFENCLLVLCNVQNVKTCDAFNLGCKTLIITRNQKVTEFFSKSINTHLAMDGCLTLAECYRLFEKYLRRHRNQLPESIAIIYRLCEGHPYLLSIIAQNLRQGPINWEKWIKNLENQDYTMSRKLSAAIEMSLNVLTDELLEMYATFAIFPPSIFIPAKLLATLWNISCDDVEHILEKFYRYSFIKRDIQDGSVVCMPPFIYRSHLHSCERILRMINPLELHRKVIAYYRVEEQIEQRTEINLFSDSLNDLYFYSCIGYHLQQAKRANIFANLYLDFGFLEQKIHAVGILTTIGNLKYYENEICGFDNRRHNLLRDICKYLLVVENKLINSDDTCLLQYALMSSGNIYEEALRQARNFPNRVWFTERGHFHQRRQIVSLTDEPKIVIFLDEDIYLIVLDNNNMIIANVSLDCNTCPVILINDGSMNATIETAQLFRNNNFILTLDKRGVLKLWDISDDFRRSLVYRRSSKQKVNPVNFKICSNIHKKRCKQSIHRTTNGKDGKIVAFHIEQTSPKYCDETRLHAIFDTGDICMFEWNKVSKQFESLKIPPVHTKDIEARFLSKLLSKYYMVLNAKGDISFWNTRDQSKQSFYFDWPHTTYQFPLIYSEVRTNTNCNCKECSFVIFVFSNKIMRLSLEQKEFEVVKPKVKTLYECARDHTITCAKLTCDGNYLVLGTNHGLVIFDIKSQSEILRSHVSEAITCVDIHKLDDRIYKYMIICGSKGKKVLNISALQRKDAGGDDDSLVWVHKTFRTNNEANTDLELEPNVWLCGHKSYVITYDEEGTFLVAADSKNRVHQASMSNIENWSLISPTETSSAITAITSNKDNTFVGYADGTIWNANNERLETQFTEEPISYLQIMDEYLLVASSENRALVLNFANDVEKRFSSLTVQQCFKIFDHYLLLILTSGALWILDTDNQFNLICHKNDVIAMQEESYICGCDFKNSHLFLATSTYTVHVYKFTSNNNDNNIEIPDSIVFTKNEIIDAKITCLTASNDASLAAIGLENGDIELYTVDEHIKCSLIYRLQSHKNKIYDMKFSANADVLVSSSETLCFWNVPYMLNNPHERNSPRRRSSRFTSQNSSDIEEVDQNVQQSGHDNHLRVMELQNSLISARLNGDIHSWQHKRGAAAKPELFACIQYDGNKGEKIFANPQFTQFNVIDDEGVHFHLELMSLSKQQLHQPEMSSAYHDAICPQIENLAIDDIDVVA